MRLPIHLFPHQSQSIIPEKIYHNYSRNNLKEEWSEIHWCSEERKSEWPLRETWLSERNSDALSKIDRNLIMAQKSDSSQFNHSSSSRRWMLPTSSKENSLVSFKALPPVINDSIQRRAGAAPGAVGARLGAGLNGDLWQDEVNKQLTVDLDITDVASPVHPSGKSIAHTMSLHLSSEFSPHS